MKDLEQYLAAKALEHLFTAEEYKSLSVRGQQECLRDGRPAHYWSTTLKARNIDTSLREEISLSTMYSLAHLSLSTNPVELEPIARRVRRDVRARFA